MIQVKLDLVCLSPSLSTVACYGRAITRSKEQVLGICELSYLHLSQSPSQYGSTTVHRSTSSLSWHNNHDQVSPEFSDFTAQQPWPPIHHQSSRCHTPMPNRCLCPVGSWNTISAVTNTARDLASILRHCRTPEATLLATCYGREPRNSPRQARGRSLGLRNRAGKSPNVLPADL